MIPCCFPFETESHYLYACTRTSTHTHTPTHIHRPRNVYTHTHTHLVLSTPSPDVDLYSCFPVCLDIFHDDFKACKPDIVTMQDMERTYTLIQACMQASTDVPPPIFISCECTCVFLIVYINIFELSCCLWAGRTL